MKDDMLREEKKKELEKMLSMTENLNDLEKAHILGYVKGMSDDSQLKKKEAS